MALMLTEVESKVAKIVEKEIKFKFQVKRKIKLSYKIKKNWNSFWIEEDNYKNKKDLKN